jgi:hypothetical protein
MRFESLDCALCLVALVVTRGDQFVLHLLFSDALFEDLQGLVVKCVLLESKTCQSHPVDYFPVYPYHLFLQPAMHRFDKDVVCIKVDCHHDVSIASLGSEWDRPRLVGVNRVGDILNAEESFLGFGDWDVVKRRVFSRNFDPDCLVFYNFLKCFLFGQSDALALALLVSFYCLVQVGVISVDEHHRWFWPCCVVSIVDGINEYFFWWESC